VLGETLRIVGVKDGKLLVRGPPEIFVEARVGVKTTEPSTYLLDLVELAYLTYFKECEVVDVDGQNLKLGDLFSKYSRSRYDWIKFTTFLDLRNRGRVAQPGYGENVLVFEMKGQRYAVYVVEENSPLNTKELLSWIDSALLKNLEPVLALVDANGDVTYYTVRKYRLEDLV
jgi:tRNA splicing endonuclease